LNGGNSSKFGNNINESKFYSRRNYKQIVIRKCLLTFGADFSSSRFPLEKIKFKVHRTIIWPVVLYGSETWSLTYREALRLRVFENRILWRINGHKGYDITRDLRKLHNVELNNL
jgi:hypothetical protein